ncbi:MAG TPA: MarR family transcriptional regulator [Candidatus Limnocylindrales bacterium]|nr:MarR family transcriptional regulator [Candidatus Limnocylindrales bacterium]
MTVPQSRALRYIGRHPGTDLSDVAAFLGMTMPSASALVTRLERAGQIVRSTDPAERRRLRLELTPDGAAVVERILGETRTWLATELRRLSADERRRLSDGVAVLAAIGEGAGSRR